MVLGLTSVSVFPQLYIDQCSLLQKHILDLGVSAYFFSPFASWNAFKIFPIQGKLTNKQKKTYIQAAASRALFKVVIMDSRKRKTAISFGSVYLFAADLLD